ncbi:hypothetical protein IGB42_00021 [Andreprevotia sp. IGB-42]|nr:hypothetical protein IGB42_00021 [Andreprevotia sp. IGB-42]
MRLFCMVRAKAHTLHASRSICFAQRFESAYNPSPAVFHYHKHFKANKNKEENMKRFALPVFMAMALALSACDEAPQQVPAPVVETGNPVLNLDRDQFKTVLAECGESLYSGGAADEATRLRCYGEIRARLKDASQPDATDAQLGSPLISERWKFEKNKSSHASGASAAS